MATPVKYPAPGCVVEYLEDNAVRIAMVMEESSGKLRLLTPTRREVRLGANRLLPWSGPQRSSPTSKEEAVRLLEEHKKSREELSAKIDTREIWELAQGEVETGAAEWFSTLLENDPDWDTVAAFGRALLQAKAYFRFQPPDFLVYDQETVERRQQAEKSREEHEELVSKGSAFLRALAGLALYGQPIPDSAIPPEAVRQRMDKMLFARMLTPDTLEDDALWKQVSKGLPEVAQLPLQLLIAAGSLPPHFNFWLERAGYEQGDEWWTECQEEVETLAAPCANLPDSFASTPFISIDGPTTRDIDDAFFIEKTDTGYHLVIALACPALNWPFDSRLDELVRHRTTSLYLPEGDLHMLPEILGTDALSLLAGSPRPAFCLELELDEQGHVLSVSPAVSLVTLAANLRYGDVQALLLHGKSDVGNPALQFAEALCLGNELAHKLEASRVAAGAVIMERPDSQITLSGPGDDPRVEIEPGPPWHDAQRIVSEMMVLASSSIANWAMEHSVALVHRTQNVNIPPQYAGVWRKPEDLAMVLKAMAASVLEVTPGRHAALAVPRYAPVTSPLRRYADLINEAQIIHFLRRGSTRWSTADLERLLTLISPSLEAASQVQRFRPRYWRLLYFQQQGPDRWWNAVITDENDAFVTVNLPDQGMILRGKRQLFDEKSQPGMHVRVRLGKVHPLYNEIHILEAIQEPEEDLGYLFPESQS